MFATTVLAVAGVVATALGAAIQPIPGTTSNSDLQTILNDASNLFAYELVGAATDVINIRDLCWVGIHQRGYDQSWSAMGLNGDNIKSTVCLESGAFVLDSTAYVASRIRPYNSEIFALQIVNAFNHSEAGLTNMCNMISTQALEQFNIDSSVVMKAVCGAAGLAVPDVNDASASINKTAVAEFYKAASALYAFELLAAANTTTLLGDFCVESPYHMDRLNALGLDGQCISDTICATRTVLSTSDAINAVIKWSTQIFIAVLKALPNSYFYGYDSYVCKWVVDQGLQSVALDAAAVRKAFC